MESLLFISATTRALRTGLPLDGGPESTVQTADREGAAGREACPGVGTGLLSCLLRKGTVFGRAPCVHTLHAGVRRGGFVQ